MTKGTNCWEFPLLSFSISFHMNAFTHSQWLVSGNEAFHINNVHACVYSIQLARKKVLRFSAQMIRFMAKFTEMLNWTQIIYNEINNVRQFLRINSIFYAYVQQDRDCRFPNFQGKPMLDSHQIVIDIIHHICQTSSVPRYVCLLGFFFFHFFYVIVFLRWVERASIVESIQMIMCIIIMNTTLYASIFLSLFFSFPIVVDYIYLFISSACRILPFLQFC